LDRLHDHELRGAVLSIVVVDDLNHSRVFQEREHGPQLPTESVDKALIAGKGIREHLYRYWSAQGGVLRSPEAAGSVLGNAVQEAIALVLAYGIGRTS
jgi:hypothetical protein